MSTNSASGLSSLGTATPVCVSASGYGAPRARDASIDALRGLAIILVVLGHAILDAGAVLHGGPRMVNMGPFWIPLSTASSVPLSLAYSFHMPLFYLRYPVHVPSLQPINRIRAASGAAGVVAGQVLPFLAAMLPYACASAAVLALLGAYLGRGGWVIEAQARLGRRSLGIYAMHGVFMWWFASHGLKNVIALMLVALGLSALATTVLERVPVAGRLLLGLQVEPRLLPRPADLLGIGAIDRGMKRALGKEPEVLEPDPVRSL